MMQAAAAVSRRSSRVPPAPSRLGVARRSRKRSRAGPGALNGEFRLRRLAGGTAANRAREPRRPIARAPGVPFGSAVGPARRLGTGTLTETLSGGPGARNDEFRLRRLAGGTAANRALEPRRRTARAPGVLADLAHVPPRLPLYACRSGRRHRKGGTAAGADTILPLLLLCWCWRCGFGGQI